MSDQREGFCENRHMLEDNGGCWHPACLGLDVDEDGHVDSDEEE